MARTAKRVCGVTRTLSPSARETVILETPARRARSAIVIARFLGGRVRGFFGIGWGIPASLWFYCR
jgi:uncharacterized membrane protein YfcA